MLRGEGYGGGWDWLIWRILWAARDVKSTRLMSAAVQLVGERAGWGALPTGWEIHLARAGDPVVGIQGLGQVSRQHLKL